MKSNLLPHHLKHFNKRSAPSEKAAQCVVIAVYKESATGRHLKWPLRVAKLDNVEIALLVCAPERMVRTAKTIDLGGSTEQSAYETAVAAKIRDALDDGLGSGQWTNAPMDGTESKRPAKSASGPRTPEVSLYLTTEPRLAEEIQRLAQRRRLDQVLFVGPGASDGDAAWTGALHEILRSVSCAVALVVPGSRQADGDVLVAADRGGHARRAIELAASLTEETDRNLIGLYVEPNIGPDAVAVGRQILDQLLAASLKGRQLQRVDQRVCVHNDPAKGIINTCREESFSLLVVGAERLGALGQRRTRSVPARVLRSKPEITMIAVRRAVTFSGRFYRWIFSAIQRHMPQLLRTDRIDLVERIQSNACWNFDFMLLIGLSTIIATLGLLDNSPAVIIGAMLVAPLMTPLIGLGLAIAQGNQRLAKMTLEAAALGFVTVFILSYGIGLLSGGFIGATAEMEARDWPQIIDLSVAFVSGLAAAYASARPGLLAALPLSSRLSASRKRARSKAGSACWEDPYLQLQLRRRSAWSLPRRGTPRRLNSLTPFWGCSKTLTACGTCDCAGHREPQRFRWTSVAPGSRRPACSNAWETSPGGISVKTLPLG
jgi:nucleotide-binding universal stress UspA family protein